MNSLECKISLFYSRNGVVFGLGSCYLPFSFLSFLSGFLFLASQDLKSAKVLSLFPKIFLLSFLTSPLISFPKNQVQSLPSISHHQPHLNSLFPSFSSCQIVLESGGSRFVGPTNQVNKILHLMQSRSATEETAPL